MKIIAVARMIRTAGAAGGPIIAGWLLFMGLDNVRAGMTNWNTLVYDATVGLGASPGVAATGQVLDGMPGPSVVAHRGLPAAPRKMVGGYAREGAAAVAAGAMDREVAKVVVGHSGRAASAGAKAVGSALDFIPEKYRAAV